MFDRIVAFTLNFLSGVMIRDEVVNGCKRHIEPFLYLHGCTPFFDMRSRSLFSEIGIYMPFTPIGPTSVISLGDILSLLAIAKREDRDML